MHTRSPLFVSLLACAAACSDAERPDRLVVGDEAAGEHTGGRQAPPISDGTGAVGGRQATGSADNALHVRVEDLGGLTIEIVTLQCAGDCAEVKAVASGGNPPYAFMWSDGSTQAGRQLCADTTTSFEVSVADTAVTDDEFAYAGQSALTTVTAKVFDCPVSDAGAGLSDAGLSDAAVDEKTPPAVCLDTSPAIDAPSPGQELGPELNWSVCGPSPELEGLDPNTPAQVCDAHYARIASYQGAPTEQESLGGVLCDPLRANEARSLVLNWLGGVTSAGLGSTIGLGPPEVDLELWGGDSQCGSDELLWTSADLAGPWVGSCIQVTPTRDHTHLRAILRVSGGVLDYRLACVALWFGDPQSVCN